MTPFNSAHELTNELVHQVADGADAALDNTRRVAQQTVDGLADKAQAWRDDASPLIRAGTDQASQLAHRAADALRQSTHQLLDGAQQATARAREQVQQDPLKSLLIAAATGAALMGLLSLVRGARQAR